jgi:hypothetical protein
MSAHLAHEKNAPVSARHASGCVREELTQGWLVPPGAKKNRNLINNRSPRSVFVSFVHVIFQPFARSPGYDVYRGANTFAWNVHYSSGIRVFFNALCAALMKETVSMQRAVRHLRDTFVRYMLPTSKRFSTNAVTRTSDLSCTIHTIQV